MCCHCSTLVSLMSNLPFHFAVRRNKVVPKSLSHVSRSPQVLSSSFSIRSLLNNGTCFVELLIITAFICKENISKINEIEFIVQIYKILSGFVFIYFF